MFGFGDMIQTLKANHKTIVLTEGSIQEFWKLLPVFLLQTS